MLYRPKQIPIEVVELSHYIFICTILFDQSSCQLFQE